MITECQNYWVSAVPAGWLAGRRQLIKIVGSRNPRYAATPSFKKVQATPLESLL